MLASCASHGSPTLSAPASYVTALDRNLIGIVAGYLRNDERLELRQIDREVRTGVDQSIKSLHMSCDAFCALLLTSSGFPSLQKVALRGWQGDALSTLKTRLLNTSYRPFDLTLLGEGKAAVGIEHLVDVRLRLLIVDGAYLQPEHSAALATATYPICLRLWNSNNIYAAMQLTTLHQINLGYIKTIDDRAANALATHQALRHLEAYELNTAAVRRIMQNPRIETLHVSRLADYLAADDAWVAHHAGLHSLILRDVAEAKVLRAIGQNAHLTSLSLTLLAPSRYEALPSLAQMPSLRSLTISSRPLHASEQQLRLKAHHIAEFCRTLFDSIELANIDIEIDTLEKLATIQANRIKLVVLFNAMTQTVIDHFRENHYLSTLHLHAVHGWQTTRVVDGMAQLAGLSQIKQLRLDIKSLEETSRSIRDAWLAANKPHDDLTVDVQRPYRPDPALI